MDAKVSVIIPSYDGSRGGNVEKILDALRKQTFQDFEAHVVTGVKPNGKARNAGVERAKGEFLVFIDDDTTIGTDKLMENFISVLEQGEKIGLVGASRFLPPDANAFQKKCQKQLMRAEFPVVEKITDSDMATHDCMAMRKRVYLEVGGESDVLQRGTDPDLRARLRKAGYRIVIAPRTFIYHPVPENWRGLVNKAYKNGMASAWVFKNYPELVYEAPEENQGAGGRGQGAEEYKKSFVERWARRFYDLLKSFLTGKWLRGCYDAAYIAGYMRGLSMSSEKIEKNIF